MNTGNPLINIAIFGAFVLATLAVVIKVTRNSELSLIHILNVESVESFASAGDLVDYSAKGNFRALGKRFGNQTPLVAGAIASADASVLSADLITHGRAFVLVTDLGEVEVSDEDVIISERPRKGWSVVNEQGETVALDLKLTPRLRQACLLYTSCASPSRC